MKRTKPDCQRLCSEAALGYLFLWYQIWKLRMIGGNGFLFIADSLYIFMAFWLQKGGKTKIFLLCILACWLSFLRTQIGSWAINLSCQTILHFTATYKANSVTFVLFYFVFLIGWVSWGERVDVVWWLRTYFQEVMEALEFGDIPPLALP